MVSDYFGSALEKTGQNEIGETALKQKFDDFFSSEDQHEDFGDDGDSASEGS